MVIGLQMDHVGPVRNISEFATVDTVTTVGSFPLCSPIFRFSVFDLFYLDFLLFCYLLRTVDGADGSQPKSLI